VLSLKGNARISNQRSTIIDPFRLNKRDPFPKRIKRSQVSNASCDAMLAHARATEPKITRITWMNLRVQDISAALRSRALIVRRDILQFVPPSVKRNSDDCVLWYIWDLDGTARRLPDDNIRLSRLGCYISVT